jgi:hypothetical protein
MIYGNVLRLTVSSGKVLKSDVRMKKVVLKKNSLFSALPRALLP